MTVAQVLFWAIAGTGTVFMTLLVYPSVRRRSESSFHSLMASLMTALLLSLPTALFCGALFHGLQSLCLRWLYPGP
jgi:hypothetical protein